MLAFLGGLWGRGWIWASLTVLVAIWLTMYALGTSYYDRLRAAVGAAQFYGKARSPASPLTAPELAAMTRSSRPLVMAAVGGIGLVLLSWLMIIKPF